MYVSARMQRILDIYSGSQIRDYARLAHGTFFIFMVDHPLVTTGYQTYGLHAYIRMYVCMHVHIFSLAKRIPRGD